jgi:putative copper export protein
VDRAVAAQPPTSRLTLLAGIALLVGLVVFGWASPATFNVYKMIHVVAAVVWVGGGTTLVILALLTERENDPRALAALGPKVEFLATRIFIPCRSSCSSSGS